MNTQNPWEIPSRTIRTSIISLQALNGRPGRQITQFHSDSILALAWSPDEKKLQIARGHLKSDVILLQDTAK
jgi:hypothetical protein